jgi:hypothetical protein
MLKVNVVILSLIFCNTLFNMVAPPRKNSEGGAVNACLSDQLEDGQQLVNRYSAALRMKLSYDVIEYIRDYQENQKSGQLKRYMSLVVTKCVKRRVETGSKDVSLRPEFDYALNNTPNSQEDIDYIVLGKTFHGRALHKSGNEAESVITSDWWWKDYFPRIKQQIYLEKSAEYYKKALQPLHTSSGNVSLQLAPEQ